MGNRALALVYGVVGYVYFLAVFLYAVGFVGNLIVPKSIDTGPAGPVNTAVIVNVMLLGLFAVQHSVMARPAFKAQWTRLVPRPVERTTYVVFTSAVLTLLFWMWQPLPAIVWQVDNPAGAFLLRALFWCGWLIVLAATFMIDHFELFGLRQTITYYAGKDAPPATFKTPLLYQYVRHPIMLGFLIAFWAAPVMSAGHLLFAVMTTVYILIAIQLEERDLRGLFGEEYDRYRQQVSMLVPRKLARSQADDPPAASGA